MECAKAASTLADGSCFVVKQTFIELVDDAQPELGTRPRAHSDPGHSAVIMARPARCYYGKVEEEEEGEMEFELDGLSDADTETEADRFASVSCHRQDALAADTTSSSSMECGAAAVLLTAASRSKVDSEPYMEHTEEDEQASWQDVAELLRENARLALENKLLRENARLTTENVALHAGAQAAVHQAAEPQFQHLPQHACLSATVAPGTWLVPNAVYDMSPQMLMTAQPFFHNSHQSACMDSQHVADAPASRRRRRQVAKTEKVEEESTKAVEERTTVMLRNLPNNYTREMLIAMLDGEGFEGLYDFIYLPIDFLTQACLGYAFVNLVQPSVVQDFWAKFEGFCNWVLPSKKICGVTWSGPHQGREAHVDRYRNSPVMHPSVPETYKPLIFEAGRRVPFPPPSKAPRAPRTRNYAAAGNRSSW